MYVFAEPVSEARADEIQSTGAQYAKEWARRVIGVGKDDAESQESWQDLQGEVDEQVSEDGAAGKDAEPALPKEETETSAENEAATEGESTAESQRSSSEAEVEVESAKEEVETEPEVEAETSVENEVENEAENEAEKEVETEDPFSPPRFEKETTTSGPLIGWTLTLRNKVNGQYVKRPEQLEREDNWQIEYNVQEIPEENAWKLYNATKERRRQLVGLGDEEVDAGLLNYRKLIQRYASRGRKWRAQQDLVEEGRGVRVFRPLGPGAEEHAEKAGSEDAGENKE